MTNEERLKNMPTEELAERLTALTEYQEFGGTFYCSPVDWELSYEDAKQGWLKWLKEECK